MPAAYAHYRFGAAMLNRMPGDIHRGVKRYRELYDAGLQGPDLLFFLYPFLRRENNKLSRKFHSQTGQEFFSRVCRGLRLEPSEAAQAYLYGLLCHYCLDTLCLPHIVKVCEEEGLSPSQAQASFDNFLLAQDGTALSSWQTYCRHAPLVLPQCEIISRFYPGTTARRIRSAMGNMSLWKQIFSQKVEFDPAYSRLNRDLYVLYGSAEQKFPAYLLRLGAHLTYNAPLGEDFAKPFG